MRRPFLTVRLVIFVLVLYLNILALGFGAWNTLALKESGLFSNLGGAPVFIIVNSCFYMACMFFALAEVVFPESRTSQVSFECGWTGILSILHLAAAIDITIMGPPELCSDSRLLVVCASSIVLVALSWITCIALTGYFLTLIFTTLSHMEVYGGIWSTSVTNVPWFVEPGNSPEVPRKDCKSGNPYENSIIASYVGPEAPLSAWMPSSKEKRPTHDIYASAGRNRDSTLPNWARKVSTRRGIDPPFQSTRSFVRSWWPGNNPLPPPPPPKPAHIHLPLYNNFHTTSTDDHHRADAAEESRISYGYFPRSVSDPDLPIEFRRISEWVQAEEHVA